MKGRALFAFTLAAGFAGALGGCDKTGAPPAAVRPVLSIVVSAHDAQGAAYAGVVEARYRVDLSFRILGRVVARDVNVGDFVRAGQRLAALDSTSLEATLRSLEASRSSAEAQGDNAEATRRREAALLAQHSTTQASVDSANQGAAAAAAAARQAEAVVEKAKEQLGYAQLLSETDGVVTAVNAQVGQTIAQGATAISIARPDVREAVIDVGEDAAVDVKVGEAFAVELQSDPSVQAEGAVREIAPDLDQATRTRRIKISLNAPPPGFRLGSTVTARALALADAQIFVPSPAILRTDGKTYVWLIEPAPGGDKALFAARRAPVELANAPGGRVRVTGGLKGDQRIAVAGANSLVEGQFVKLDASQTP